jgi:hypothetical protein
MRERGSEEDDGKEGGREVVRKRIDEGRGEVARMKIGTTEAMVWKRD